MSTNRKRLGHDHEMWLAATMARNAARFGGWSMELDPAAPVADPVVDPATPPAPEAPKASPWDDPTAAKAEIERLRRENASDRTNAKAKAAEDARAEYAQIINKALGVVDDTPVDPAALTEKVSVAQADAKRARVELAVFRTAAQAGGDPIALLDSTSFLAKVADLDPANEAAIAEAVTAAVEANSRLGAAPVTPKAPGPNPAQGATGGGVTQQATAADLDRMTPAEVVEARKAGRLNNLMGA